MGETDFVRHPAQIEAIVGQLRSLHARHARPVRVWCAGCASGEEPYGLAMRLHEEGAPYEILASDVNEAALARARAASGYSDAAVGHLPERLRERWLAPSGPKRWRIESVDRLHVAFAGHDLVEQPPLRPGSGTWTSSSAERRPHLPTADGESRHRGTRPHARPGRRLAGPVRPRARPHPGRRGRAPARVGVRGRGALPEAPRPRLGEPAGGDGRPCPRGGADRDRAGAGRRSGGHPPPASRGADHRGRDASKPGPRPGRRTAPPGGSRGLPHRRARARRRARPPGSSRDRTAEAGGAGVLPRYRAPEAGRLSEARAAFHAAVLDDPDDWASSYQIVALYRRAGASCTRS